MAKTKVYTKMPFAIGGAIKKLKPKRRDSKIQAALRKATGGKKK